MLCMSWSPYALAHRAGRAQDLQADAGLGLCGGHTLSLEILLCHSIKNIQSSTQVIFIVMVLSELAAQ